MNNMKNSGEICDAVKRVLESKNVLDYEEHIPTVISGKLKVTLSLD